MLGSIISSIGGSVGKYFGGGILSTIGRYAGKQLGDYLEKKWFQKKITTNKFTNVKDSFRISKAEYGTPIPLIFGRMRLYGQIIWADRITQKRNISSISKYFKKANTTVNRQTTELEYYANFAIALCEGEILDIDRVWYNDELIDLSRYKFRLYKGDEEQLPDPLISSLSEEPTPGYRGLAYIVFEELPLADFNDMIPNFSFEVSRKANIKKDASVEEIVKSMIMIPGSGEYVYDTIIQEKTLLSPYGGIIAKNNINSHNHYNIADSIHSLNQLQMVCENIEWVAPVVCWFGDNVNAKDCIIRPAVEFKNKNITYSENWRVGKYDRNNAYEITKDEHNNPIYGGSINDASVIRYLAEIRSRNLKIMFYPMFFLDVDLKPWRGRVTGEPQDIANFFNREHGYNDFILHYANLVKDHVDAFIIGSELIGLTRVTDGMRYPAVDELVKLAARVKQIMGNNVEISYAADWSEYHHTEGGWFNLDPLWSSPNIDFIGIDAYFPVTNSLSSAIKPEDIAVGWMTGEGYDYYIDQKDQTKKTLQPQYAWKNLRYWWENVHINPNNMQTNWVPRSKKIWFTEFGFPSIDKAPNQPNVFFDPKCIDGGVPRYSSGEIDFSIQRKAIRAFIEYWQTQEYIGQMFLWTWDARPYPAWPHMNIWRDEHLWEKGHWVNNKFGASNLASIILEISHRCLINIDNIDVSSIDQPVEGYLICNKITALDAINTLRATYFFDINSYASEIITFVKRGYGRELTINPTKCIKLTENSFFEEVEIPSTSTLGKIDLYYIDQNDHYNSHYKYINNESKSYINKASINLPIVMTEFEAQKIGTLIINNAAVEDRLIKFIISSIDTPIKPCDFVTLHHNEKQYSLRLINVVFQGLKLIITGIIDDRNSYFTIPHAKSKLNMISTNKIEDRLVVRNIPHLSENINLPSVVIYFRGSQSSTLYAKFAQNNDWSRVKTIQPSSHSIAQITHFHQSQNSNIFLIDEESYLLIQVDNFTPSSDDEWKFAFVGQELIGFKNICQTDKNLYHISYLTRALHGTEQYMNHNTGEFFVMIDNYADIITVSDKLENQQIDFKCGTALTSMVLPNLIDRCYLPIITEKKITHNNLYLKWSMRHLDDGNWQFKENNTNYQFIIEIISNGKNHIYQTFEREINIDLNSFTLSDNHEINIMIHTNQ